MDCWRAPISAVRTLGDAAVGMRGACCITQHSNRPVHICHTAIASVVFHGISQINLIFHGLISRPPAHRVYHPAIVPGLQVSKSAGLHVHSRDPEPQSNTVEKSNARKCFRHCITHLSSASLIDPGRSNFYNLLPTSHHLQHEREPFQIPVRFIPFAS